MANGGSDRNVLAVVVTILALLATMVGGALSFHQRIVEDVRATFTAELKHTVTRAELAELRRTLSDAESVRHLSIIRRLDLIEFQLKAIRRVR